MSKGEPHATLQALRRENEQLRCKAPSVHALQLPDLVELSEKIAHLIEALLTEHRTIAADASFTLWIEREDDLKKKRTLWDSAEHRLERLGVYISKLQSMLDDPNGKDARDALAQSQDKISPYEQDARERLYAYKEAEKQESSLRPAAEALIRSLNASIEEARSAFQKVLQASPRVQKERKRSEPQPPPMEVPMEKKPPRSIQPPRIPRKTLDAVAENMVRSQQGKGNVWKLPGGAQKKPTEKQEVAEWMSIMCAEGVKSPSDHLLRAMHRAFWTDRTINTFEARFMEVARETSQSDAVAILEQDVKANIDSLRVSLRKEEIPRLRAGYATDLHTLWRMTNALRQSKEKGIPFEFSHMRHIIVLGEDDAVAYHDLLRNLGYHEALNMTSTAPADSTRSMGHVEGFFRGIEFQRCITELHDAALRFAGLVRKDLSIPCSDEDVPEAARKFMTLLRADVHEDMDKNLSRWRHVAPAFFNVCMNYAQRLIMEMSEKNVTIRKRGAFAMRLHYLRDVVLQQLPQRLVTASFPHGTSFPS